MSRILIIDDDLDIAESMKIVLESKQYTVDIAGSGKDGLEKVELKKPDLIILDIMMETGDKGFDVARVLKKDQNYKDIPILMLTAIKDRTGFDFRRQSGDKEWLPVDEYCDKPLSPEELILKVGMLLTV